MEAQQSLESAAKFRLAALCSAHGVHDELLLACLTSSKGAAAVPLPEINVSSSKNEIYMRTDRREAGPSQGSSENVSAKKLLADLLSTFLCERCDHVTTHRVRTVIRFLCSTSSDIRISCSVYREMNTNK